MIMFLGNIKTLKTKLTLLALSCNHLNIKNYALIFGGCQISPR